jgi:uncharacterized membrane protein
MKKPTVRKIILALSVINMIAIILMIALRIPDTVATHFNYKGEADAYGSKWNYVMFAFLPVILSVCYEIYRQKSNNAKGNQAMEDKLIPLISVVFIAIGWLFIPLSNADSMSASAGGSIFLIFGILMIVLSNYMGKIQQNRHLGIRIPWTLKNETVWKKTHRLGGFTGVAGGIVLIIGGIIGLVNPDSAFIAGMICLIIAITLLVIIPTVYSYVLYKKVVSGED